MLPHLHQPPQARSVLRLPRRIVAKCPRCHASYNADDFEALRQRGPYLGIPGTEGYEIRSADCRCGNGIEAGVMIDLITGRPLLMLSADELVKILERGGVR